MVVVEAEIVLEQNYFVTIFCTVESGMFFYTANRKHPYTTRTLANGQSVREYYGRFQQCKAGLREILQIV